MRRQALLLLTLICTLSSSAWSQTNPAAPVDTTRVPADTMKAASPQPAPHFNRDSAFSARRAALEAAQRAWRERGPSSYAYTLTIICFCNYRGEYGVEVRRGRIASVEFRQMLYMAAPATREARLPYVLTVAQLFDRAREQVRADQIVVATYHPELGYPLQITLGDGTHMGPPENPAFIGYRITDLRPL